MGEWWCRAAAELRERSGGLSLRGRQHCPGIHEMSGLLIPKRFWHGKKQGLFSADRDRGKTRMFIAGLSCTRHRLLKLGEPGVRIEGTTMPATLRADPGASLLPHRG